MKPPANLLSLPSSLFPRIPTEDIHDNIEDLLNHIRGVCHCSADSISLVFLIFNACFALCAIITVAINLAFVLTVALNKPLWRAYTNKLLLSNAVVGLYNLTSIFCCKTSVSVIRGTVASAVSFLMTDMLVGMLVMPFHITKNIQSNCWKYGDSLCDVAQSVDLHLTTLSIFHLTGVS